MDKTSPSELNSNPPPSRASTQAPQPSFTAVRAAGRDWFIESPGDIDSLWEAMTDDDSAAFADERIPYWAEIWPSSLGLAEWLVHQQQAVAGKVCFDLGCGLGLTAIIGQWLGAKVVGLDYEEQALRHAKANAVENLALPPSWMMMDWRFPALQKQSIPVMWGSDIVYEQRFFTPIMNLFEQALSSDGTIWLAEPGRSLYGKFLEQLANNGWHASHVHSQRVLPENRPPHDINIWQIQRQ